MSDLFALPGPVWVELGLVLAHAVWQGAAIAMVLAVVLRWLGRGSADVRYGACGVGLVAMALCPLVTFAYLRVAPPAILDRIRVSSMEVPVAAEPGRLTRRAGETPTGTLDASLGDGIDPTRSHPMNATPAHVGDAAARTAHIEPPAGGFGGSLTGSSFLGDGTAEDRFAFGLSLAAWVWAGGVAVLTLRLVVGWLGLHRLRRSGTEALPAAVQNIVEALRARLGLGARVSVRATDSVREPVAFGLIRPIVLLPVSLLSRCPVELVEAMLVHELAHIRRLDLWVNLAQRVIETFLFYHPAVWWISGRMRLERELCCDDVAVRVTGRRAEYAEALVDMARAAYGIPAPALAAGMFTSRMTMLTRVRRVLGLPPAAQYGRFWLAGPLSLLLAGSMVLVSRIHAADDGPKDPTAAIAEASPTETDAVSDSVATDDPIDGSSATDPPQSTTIAAALHALVDSASVTAVSAAEVAAPGETAVKSGAPPKTSIIKTQFDEVASFKSQLDEQRAWLAPVLDVIKGFQTFHIAIYKPDREALMTVFRPEGRAATAQDVEQLFADLEALGLHKHEHLWSDPWDVSAVYVADEVERATMLLGTFSVDYHGRSWRIRIECRLMEDDDLGWFVTNLAATAMPWNGGDCFEQFVESLHKDHPENPEIVILTVDFSEGSPRTWKEIARRAGEGAHRDGRSEDVRLMVGVNRQRFVAPIRNSITRPNRPNRRSRWDRQRGGRVFSSAEPTAAAPAEAVPSASRGGSSGSDPTAGRPESTGSAHSAEPVPGSPPWWQQLESRRRSNRQADDDGRAPSSEQPAAPVAQPRPAATHRGVSSPRPTRARFGGDSTAFTEHQHVVRSRTDGLVDKVAVKRGQRVEKGQLLVALDASEAGFEVSAAELGVRSADAELRRLAADPAGSRAVKAESLKAKVALDAAELALERSKHRLERTRIVSPVDGVVAEIRRAAAPGKKISAGEDLIVIDTRPNAGQDDPSVPGVGMPTPPTASPSTLGRGSAGASSSVPQRSGGAPAAGRGHSPSTVAPGSDPRVGPTPSALGASGFGGVSGSIPGQATAPTERGGGERAIFARAEGLIEEVAVKVGQRVKKGDTLVRLDTLDAEFAYREASIHLKSAEAGFAQSLQQRKSQVISESEFAKLKSALELARLELDRAGDRMDRMRVVSPVDGVVRHLMPWTLAGAKVQAGMMLLGIESTRDASEANPPDARSTGTDAISP